MKKRSHRPPNTKHGKPVVIRRPRMQKKTEEEDVKDLEDKEPEPEPAHEPPPDEPQSTSTIIRGPNG